MHIQYDKRGDVIPLGARHSLLLSFDLKGFQDAATRCCGNQRDTTRTRALPGGWNGSLCVCVGLLDPPWPHVRGKHGVECTDAPKRLLSSRLRALHAAAPSRIETRLGDSSHDAAEEVSQVSFSCFWVCARVWCGWHDFPRRLSITEGSGVVASRPLTPGSSWSVLDRGEMSVAGEWSLFCDSKAERNEASALLWSTKVSIKTFS